MSERKNQWTWKAVRIILEIFYVNLRRWSCPCALLVKHCAMKAYGEWIYRSTFLLTSAPVGDEWSASRLGHFTPGERASGSHWIGGRVDCRASLDDTEKRKFLTLPGIELRTLGCPACSQSLYRLHYPSFLYILLNINTYIHTSGSRKSRLTAVGICYADQSAPSIHKSWH
jgi:hypothetical protein